VIRVAGIQVPLFPMAELARRLHETHDHALSNRIGQAIDSGATEMQLNERELAELLVAIERHPVEGLEELRFHLLERLRDSN
jgi:hypothetical protein